MRILGLKWILSVSLVRARAFWFKTRVPPLCQISFFDDSPLAGTANRRSDSVLIFVVGTRVVILLKKISSGIICDDV